MSNETKKEEFIPTLNKKMDELKEYTPYKELIKERRLAEEYSRVKFMFTRTPNKDGSWRTKLILNFAKGIDIEVPARSKDGKTLHSNDVMTLFLLTSNANIDQNQITSECYIRFLKGQSVQALSDDGTYERVEIILSKEMNPISFFLSGITRKLLTLGEKRAVETGDKKFTAIKLYKLSKADSEEDFKNVNDESE